MLKYDTIVIRKLIKKVSMIITTHPISYKPSINITYLTINYCYTEIERKSTFLSKFLGILKARSEYFSGYQAISGVKKAQVGQKKQWLIYLKIQYDQWEA